MSLEIAITKLTEAINHASDVLKTAMGAARTTSDTEEPAPKKKAPAKKSTTEETPPAKRKRRTKAEIEADKAAKEAAAAKDDDEFDDEDDEEFDDEDEDDEEFDDEDEDDDDENDEDDDDEDEDDEVTLAELRAGLVKLAKIPKLLYGGKEVTGRTASQRLVNEAVPKPPKGQKAKSEMINAGHRRQVLDDAESLVRKAKSRTRKK